MTIQNILIKLLENKYKLELVIKEETEKKENESFYSTEIDTYIKVYHKPYEEIPHIKFRLPDSSIVPISLSLGHANSLNSLAQTIAKRINVPKLTLNLYSVSQKGKRLISKVDVDTTSNDLYTPSAHNATLVNDILLCNKFITGTVLYSGILPSHEVPIKVYEEGPAPFKDFDFLGDYYIKFKRVSEKGYVVIPLNLDTIESFDDLLYLLTAFISPGNPVKFNIYSDERRTEKNAVFKVVRTEKEKAVIQE